MPHETPLLDIELESLDAIVRLVPWQTVVWDDPVNLMSYVTYVFQQYFGFPRDKAEQLMMRVHTEGSAVVATGNREAMERHVLAMHGYGLNATVRRADDAAS
ncbi:MAG TPA: ATP-dependent Clp protease adapter ClpS [Microbacteriaceae bacterium]|nr:ATP-dependent Clp protease adapter ClpS [Microbacteriaceae bacterium]